MDHRQLLGLPFLKNRRGRGCWHRPRDAATTVIGADPGSIPAAQLFSFAVAIRDKQSEIHTQAAKTASGLLSRKRSAWKRFFRILPGNLIARGPTMGPGWSRYLIVVDPGPSGPG